MPGFRLILLTILFLCPLIGIAQSHDFEIKNFHENVTDLTAATSNVKDLNGVTAALIRFAVRDTLFTFEANNGILKQSNAVGEIFLYVPANTKRITIKHPVLGILRDYQLPTVVKSKTTYDVEITITNVDYLRNLYAYNQLAVNTEPTKNRVEIVEPTKETPPNKGTDDVNQSFVKKMKRINIPRPHFIVGGGFNALSVMGPTVNVGIEVGNIMLAADYTMGLEKVEGVGINYNSGYYNRIEYMIGAYDYSASRLSVRLGFNVNPDAKIQIVPQIGVSLDMIKGTLITEKEYEPQFSKASPTSLSAALSLRIKLSEALCLCVTPQYNFLVGTDDVFNIIKEADSKIKSWGEGIGVSAGILLRF